MEISEDAGQTWREMPPWVRYFLDLGHRWPRRISGPGRTIRIVSMPIKTPAAGLIALGAVTADLADSTANDRHRHYDTILSYARQYLHACRDCRFRCRPDIRKCGYSSEASGFLRHKDRPLAKLFVTSETDFQAKILRFSAKADGSGAKTTVQGPDWQHIFDYYESEGIPLSLGRSAGRVDKQDFAKIFPTTDFFEPNLSTSYSSLCFAGGASGQTASQGEMEFFCFKGDKPKSLASLLPIHGWDNGSTELSRLIYFNTRGKGTFTQALNNPNLVIADGMDALTSVLSEKKLKSSDVIAVVNRIHERDKMEEFGALLEGQAQWYERIDLGPSVVSGCFETELRKRVAS
jgi:hypothetical protein